MTFLEVKFLGFRLDDKDEDCKEEDDQLEP